MNAGTQLKLRAKAVACMVLLPLLGCGGSPKAPASSALPMTGQAGVSSAPAGATGKDGGSGGSSPAMIAAGTGGSTSTAGQAGLSGTAGTSTAMAGSGPSAGAAGGAAGAAGDAAAAGTGAPPATHAYLDPGKDEWVRVAEADVPTVCKLDVAKLKAAETSANYPWMIVRYGKYCWGHNADNFPHAEAYSTTKTLGALVTGIASYQTRMIPRTGPKTGQLSDEDPVTQWLDTVSYNKSAKVAHVLGMVAHDPDLSYGKRSFTYDTVGTTEINSLGTMISAAIAQDPARLGKSVPEFTQKFLYEPLGMKNSSWPGTVFAYTWNTDLKDMARVGVLINNYGMWAGERLLDEQWVYRQTHPSFEDSNTGFGYLTWLNSSSNFTSIDSVKKQGAAMPGPCAPVCIHKSYPHGVSEAKDCGYTTPYTCDQMYDVGVWNAEGLQGQLIEGHRGLDLVIVARNAQPSGLGPGTEKQLWDALRAAVIAADPTYKGDEAAFCKAYGSNSYAPDLK
jgi:hypothetical protein